MRLNGTVRLAEEKDASAIAAIYNEAILKTVATMDTVTKSEEDRLNWMRRHSSRYPVFVYESNGEVLGWASLSEWSDRCAYSGTAENSVYVFERRHGCGIGGELMRALMSVARENKIHTVVARISDGNEASIKLHQRFGFQLTGVMKQVGHKFGRFVDVHIMQIIFE